MQRKSTDILDKFFAYWIFRHKVTATVEGGLKFQEAQQAWEAVRTMLWSYEGEIAMLTRDVTYHKAMHQKYITAYQEARCKNVGDFVQMFVRRKRMRPLIRFLLSA